ncbi:MAG: hypothetical protein JXB17_13915 [Bacteroidales bacterium]|nr:hypothetical protein [Bacteroidales bacterium]
MKWKKMNHFDSTRANFSQHLICLDLVKGIGILEFICWHVFVNFYLYKPDTAALNRVVFSVTGFFVFSSGFLVGFHYYAKLQLSKVKDPACIFKRLCVRALKLFIIVLMANFTILFFKTKNFSSGNILYVLEKLASLLYIDRWDISLQVLMSIALTLIASYLLMLLFHRFRYALHVFLLLLALIILIDLITVDPIPYLWRYGLHGIFGLIVGMFFFQNIFSGYYSNRFKIAILGFVFLGIFFVTVLIVIIVPSAHEFFLYNLGPSLLAVSAYFVGFSNIFYLLYDLEGRSLNWSGKILKNLGAQSLLVYLIQITLINLIVLIFKKFKLYAQWECFVVSILIALVCFVLSILVGYYRQHSIVDRIYSIVFQ